MTTMSAYFTATDLMHDHARPAPSPLGMPRRRASNQPPARTREDAAARYERMRRADCRAHGYRGPLTRAEASAQALAALAGQ